MCSTCRGLWGLVVVQLSCSSVVGHYNSNTVSLVWFPAAANLHCPYTVLEVSECLDNGEHYVATAISPVHDVQPTFTALIQFLKLASWMLGQWWPLCCHCYIISDVLIFKTSHAWWWAQDWNFMFGFWKVFKFCSISESNWCHSWMTRIQ